jgi:hypothetical protein
VVVNEALSPGATAEESASEWCGRSNAKEKTARVPFDENERHPASLMVRLVLKSYKECRKAISAFFWRGNKSRKLFDASEASPR